MAKLIIITGFLATLKTTIAQRLSDDLKIPLLCKDSIKEVLVDAIGFSNREENLKLSNATFRMIQYMIKEYITNRINVITESNFKPHELQELNEFLKGHPVEILSIFLYGHCDVLYKRYVERQPRRHPAHTSTGLLSFDTFCSSIEGYRKEDCLGKIVGFDTTHFDEVSYGEILNIVKDFVQS